MHVAYVPLHVHTIYTPYRSLIHPARLIERLSFLKIPAVGVVDAWTSYHHFKLFSLAAEQGIKVIFGAEVQHPSAIGAEGRFHLTLLAENNEGYRNLVKIISLHNSRSEGGYITGEELLENKDGLIALSGCSKSEVSSAISGGKLGAAREVLEWLAGIFGDDHLFIEMMNHNEQHEYLINEHLTILAKKMGIPTVATNNDRFLEREDAVYFKELVRLFPGSSKDRITDSYHTARRLKKLIAHPSQPETTESEDGIEQYYLKREKDILPMFYSEEEAVHRSGAIADRCNVELPLEVSKFHFSRVGSDEQLEQMCRRRFLLNYHDSHDVSSLEERMTRELRRCAREGLCDFFLFLKELFDRMRVKGVHIEVASGSIIESFIAFLLDLVALNPLEHGLVFRSFNHGSSNANPSIEFIVPRNAKDRFIETLRTMIPGLRLYFHVAQEEMSLNTLISKLCDLYGVSEETKTTISRELSFNAASKNLNEFLESSETVSRIYSSSSTARRVLHTAFRLRGNVLHFVSNSSRVVLIPEDLSPWFSTYGAKGGIEFICVDEESVGRLNGWIFGVQQSHFLSAVDAAVRMLGGSRNAESIGSNDRGANLFFLTDDLNDANTYATLSGGDTTGIYFLEGAGFKEFIAKVNPIDFDELVDSITLYKPRPLEGRLWEKYVKRHVPAEPKLSTAVPEVERILSKTRGVLLYIEQIRMIIDSVSGLKEDEALMVENSLKSQAPNDLAASRLLFLKGAIGNGRSEEEATRIFDSLMQGIRFTHSKAQSIQQAYLSYRTAYLKTHHFMEYFAALLNGNIDVPEKMKEYLEYIEGNGVNVLPSDVNKSFLSFVVEDGSIRRPLLAKVEYFDELRLFLEERSSRGAFESFEDFLARCRSLISKEAVSAMIDAGVFATFGMSEEQMRIALETTYRSEVGRGAPQMQKAGKTKEKNRVDGGDQQLSLFEDEE